MDKIAPMKSRDYNNINRGPMFTRNFSAASYGLIFVFILGGIFTGCSAPPPKDEQLEPNYLLSLRIRPTWFHYRKDRANKSDENRIEGHPFYDFNPFVNLKTETLNFFTVTPYLSDTLFGLDLSSGRRYRVHNLCPQTDIWRKYSFRIKGPPFTHGIVPRTVDQLGKPQEIFVYGNERVLADFPGLYAHRARVVGAVIIQECPIGNCQPVQWQSRMILVAVDPMDADYKDVKNLDDLKDAEDWNYFEAYLQNYRGHINRFQKRFPFTRIVGEAKSKEALRIILKPNQQLSKEDRIDIAKNCHKLYDFTLKTLGPKSSTKNYYKRFRSFYKKFEGEYRTCMNYVQYDSINYSPQNHWFFAHIEGFMQMHDMDYSFDCDSKSWEPLSDRKKDFDMVNYVDNCSDIALETAIETAPFTLKKLGLNNLPTQKYIEYDSRKGGSHEKIYSFAYLPPAIVSCELNSRKDEEFFPKDVKWTSRIQKDLDPTIIR